MAKTLIFKARFGSFGKKVFKNKLEFLHKNFLKSVKKVKYKMNKFLAKIKD